MPKTIFLSHNSADKETVRRVAQDLKRFSISYWLDEAEILVGDSLIAKISDGISRYDFLGVFLSKNSVESEWVNREVNIALHEEINGRRVKVLPILIDDCSIPVFLRDKLYADFRPSSDYDKALSHVLDRLEAGLFHDETVAPELKPVFSQKLSVSFGCQACICPATKQLFVAQGSELTLTNILTGEATDSIQTAIEDFSCAAISADGSKRYAGDRDGNIVCWTGEGLSVAKASYSDDYTPMFQAIYPRDQVALSLGIAGNPDFHLWDLSKGQHTRQLENQGFFPNTHDLLGSHLLAGSHEGHIRAWNTRSYAPDILNSRAHRSSVNAVCILPGAKVGFSGDGDGALVMWDLENAREASRVEPRSSTEDNGIFGGIRAIYPSPKGNYIAVSAQNLKILEATTCRCVATIPASYLTAFSFSADEEEVYIVPEGEISGYELPAQQAGAGQPPTRTEFE